MSSTTTTPLFHKSLSSTQPTIVDNNIKNIIQDGNKLSRHCSLNKLGRKKTVSFSANINIINVDSWKRYNIDVSETGGCLAWDMKKNEERRKEEEKKKKKEEKDGCQCIVY